MPESAHDANAAGVDARTAAGADGAARPRPPHAGVVIGVRPAGGRVVVTVRGELDLDTTGRLERALHGALGAAADGIDLELDAVAFCDCSALNVLLGAREDGLREGKTVAVRTVSPPVARLLDLTGTAPLFDPYDTPDTPDTVLPPPSAPAGPSAPPTDAADRTGAGPVTVGARLPGDATGRRPGARGPVLGP
ncbi:STAS domain-containing protein [Streptomyces sp. NBC_00704]|uniref:STAS domain-containing protein n=1 Tax=Streptomyces sp. NBC_00704 TaxID=2975809 RepID=UPI002E32B8B8|nr:STAS domain-containing protein [Streptomyces sp. NBC_00704]